MKIQTIIFILFIASQFINAQKKPFKAKNLKSTIKSHESFAILPFEVNTNVSELPEGITQEMLREGELAKGIELQTSLYTHLVRKLRRKDLSIQDIDKTNRLLKKNGITIENFLDYDPSELAAILKVDGIFLNKAKTTEPLTAKDKRKAQLIHSTTKVITGFGFGSRSRATINSRLYDTKTDKLIWSWEYTVKGGITDSDEAIQGFIKYYTKINPYKKK